MLPRAGSSAEPICSLAYAPPEVVLALGHHHVANPAADMWAVGVIMYECAPFVVTIF